MCQTSPFILILLFIIVLCILDQPIKYHSDRTQDDDGKLG